MHYPLILADILVAFKGVGIRLAVAAAERHLSGTLFGLNDRHHVLERSDSNDGLAAMIGSGNSKFKVPGFFEAGRNIRKVKVDEMRKLLGDLAEDVIIQVPRLIEVSGILRSAVLIAPVECFI